ncbi:MAG: PD40 domain-containing protein [Bacteroidaceae bacterium]|nr:PD40 domain-containing protein [Bacteroidaceae bacterium]
MKQYIFSFFLVLVLLTACSTHPSLPQDYRQEGTLPDIYPDYTDVTVPINIAPLNFMVEEADKVVARIQAGDVAYNYGKGNKVIIPENEWRELLASAKGKKMQVDVYCKQQDKWSRYKSFGIEVSADSIDPYISYRALAPTYVGFEHLAIRQRCLENFKESDIFNTRQLSTEREGVCINCHSYQNYRTDNMMFHIRICHDATVIVSDGKLRNVLLKTPEMISAAVYPSWHPTLKLIAFSTDRTVQSFHTRDITKVEVMESASDIVFYDVEKNTIQTVLADSIELELFPSWSPDGKWLYFCSARHEFEDMNNGMNETLNHYKELQYNLYRAPFDMETRTLGEPELIYDAVSKSRSAVEQRVSSDNRYVLFAEGPHGLFHIWHPTAQIEILDQQTGQLVDTRAINSDRAESYPSFSSNDRWILFESRRDDGNYTRDYLAYFDRKGKVHKAFLVPQQDPEFFRLSLFSWSRPEFMKEPVKITPRMFLDQSLKEAGRPK